MNYWYFTEHETDLMNHLKFIGVMALIFFIIFSWAYLIKKLFDRD